MWGAADAHSSNRRVSVLLSLSKALNPQLLILLLLLLNNSHFLPAGGEGLAEV